MWVGVVDVLHRIGGEEREVEGKGVLMPCEVVKGWVIRSACGSVRISDG